MIAVASLRIAGWAPGIGDPTIYGWVTVIAYFLAALLAWRAAVVAPSSLRPGAQTRRERRFWRALALAMVALGINKQLDLQSLLTALARVSAEQQGWYADRRPVQRAFVTIIAVVGLASVVGVVRYLRHASGWLVTAAGGLAVLTTFVVIRAASFHHIDLVLRSGVSGLRVNHLLELGGIALIAVAATGAAWPARRRICRSQRCQP